MVTKLLQSDWHKRCRALIASSILIWLVSPALLLAGEPSSKLDPVSIQLKWQHAFQFAGYYAAIDQGFYRDKGLDVTLKPVDLSKDLVNEVINNESQYGVSDSTLLIYHLKGQPVVLVNQFFQHSPLVFLSRRDSGIISPYEMVGKKVSYNASNEWDASLNALLLKTLGDLNKTKPLKLGRSYYQDFIDGKIDVISAYSTSQPFLLKEQGIDVNIINPQNYGIDFYGDNFFTTQKELTEHPDRVAKMSQATVKGWQYALDHPKQIINLIRKKYNPQLSEAYLQYEARTTKDMLVAELIVLGSVDPSRYRLTAETYQRLGLTDTSHVGDSFFYNLKEPDSKVSINLSTEEKTWIHDHPVVRYGGEKDWPPYDFIDEEGNHSGLSRDMLELIGKYTGLKFQPEIANWDALLAKTKAHKIDLLPVLYDPEDRHDYLTFTKPYQTALSYFFVHETVQARTFDDLNGKTLAIPKGYGQINLIKERFPKLRLLETENLNAAIQAVIERKADMLLENYSVMNYSLKQYNISVIRPFKVMPSREVQNLAMAVRKDLPVLFSIIQKNLDAIPEKEKQEINDKWLGHQENQDGQAIDLNNTEKKWLSEHPVIRFTGDPDWLPYEAFDKQGRYIGMVDEYLQLLEKKLHIKFDIIPTRSWSESIDKIKHGEVDMLSETVDSDLQAQLLFTQPYLSSPVVIVMRDDLDYVDSISHIKHLRLAVIKDYGYNPAIFRAYPDIKFSEIETIQKGLLAVSTGKIDALICTLAQASYQIANQGINNVRIVGKTEFTTQLGFGVRKDFAPLVALVSKALNSINEREKQRISDQWGKDRFAAKTDYQLLTKIVAGFLLLLTLIFFWARRLVKEISRRKQSEQQVMLLNQRFALASSVASLGIWELDLQGEQPHFNFDDKIYEMYGITEQDQLSRTVQHQISLKDWLLYVHNDDHALIKQSLANLKDGGGELHIEYRIIRPDGNIRNIYCASYGTRVNGKLTKIDQNHRC